MAEVIKFKAVADYNGHSIKTNKSVDLGMKFAYSELTSYIKLIQLLNENIEVSVKIGDAKPIKLGTYMLKELKVDHDGQGLVKFNSQLDFVEADNLTILVGEKFTALFKATVENVEEEEDE